MKKPAVYGLLVGVCFVLLAAASSRSAPLPVQQQTLVSQHAVVPMNAPAHFRMRAAQDDEEENQTFAGTISKSGDKFVLVGEGNVTYNLDDQDKAKAFENKKVKVTGTLDKDSNTIKVADIQEASEEEPG